MTYRQPFLTFVAAAFGLCFVGNASALIRGGYGGKDIQEGFDLVCEADPTDERIEPGKILFPAVAFDEISPDYELKGQWVCWEEKDGVKQDLDGDPNQTPDEFVVDVMQQTELLQGPGLSATFEDPEQDGIEDWTFTFKVRNGPPVENLLFYFVPKDPDDQTPGNQSPACIDQMNPTISFNPCYVQVGTPQDPKAGDFPDGRDIDGVGDADLNKGEVFIYTVVLDTNTQTETPMDLFDGSCTSGTFNGMVEVNDGCEFSLTGKKRDNQPTRGKVSGTPELNAKVDIQPGSDDNFLVRSDTGDMLVSISSNDLVDVSMLDPATFELAETSLTSCTGNSATITCVINIQDLIANSTDLQFANPGDKFFLPFTSERLDGTDVGGSDFVTIVLPVRVDYRPGCGNNLALNNPNGSDPVAILGGPVGAYDNVDVTQIDTGSVVFEVLDPDGETINQVPLTYVGNSDNSGSNCSGTPGDDGNSDGHLDARFRVDVSELFDASKALQDAADDDPVALPLIGNLSGGARIQGSAWVKVQK